MFNLWLFSDDYSYYSQIVTSDSWLDIVEKLLKFINEIGMNREKILWNTNTINLWSIIIHLWFFPIMNNMNGSALQIYLTRYFIDRFEEMQLFDQWKCLTMTRWMNFAALSKRHSFWWKSSLTMAVAFERKWEKKSDEIENHCYFLWIPNHIEIDLQ